jgi:hypothetical protein
MRVARALLLPGIVAGLIAFGWTYEVPGPPPPPLSDAELGWVGQVRDWLREPLPVRCAGALADAPTDRLDEIRRAFRDACDEADPAEALVRSREARARLAAELRSRRDLEAESGLVARSRVEPRLGKALTVLGGGRPVEVRCWAQADWRAVRAEEAALTGGRFETDSFWLPHERSLHLQGVHCGPLVRLSLGQQPRARGRRVDLSLALWTVARAAERFSTRPCVPPARLAMLLDSPRGYAVGIVRFARSELGPLLPAASRRCRTSRPS